MSLLVRLVEPRLNWLACWELALLVWVRGSDATDFEVQWSIVPTPSPRADDSIHSPILEIFVLIFIPSPPPITLFQIYPTNKPNTSTDLRCTTAHPTRHLSVRPRPRLLPLALTLSKLFRETSAAHGLPFPASDIFTTTSSDPALSFTLQELVECYRGLIVLIHLTVCRYYLRTEGSGWMISLRYFDRHQIRRAFGSLYFILNSHNYRYCDPFRNSDFLCCFV